MYDMREQHHTNRINRWIRFTRIKDTEKPLYNVFLPTAFKMFGPGKIA